MPQNEFNTVLLYKDDVKAIYNALVSSGNNKLAQNLAVKSARTKIDFQYIAAAKRLDDEAIEIDDDTVVSKAQDGAFILGWHWIEKSAIQNKPI